MLERAAERHRETGQAAILVDVRGSAYTPSHRGVQTSPSSSAPVTLGREALVALRSRQTAA